MSFSTGFSLGSSPSLICPPSLTAFVKLIYSKNCLAQRISGFWLRLVVGGKGMGCWYSTEALSNMNGGGQLRCRKREKEATEPIFSKILLEVCLKTNLLFLACISFPSFRSEFQVSIAYKGSQHTCDNPWAHDVSEPVLTPLSLPQEDKTQSTDLRNELISLQTMASFLRFPLYGPAYIQ